MRIIKLSAITVLVLVSMFSITGCGSGADAGAVDIIKGQLVMERTGLKPDSVQLGSWTRQTGASDDNHIITHWKAATTFPEPYGFAIMVVDGHPIIHIAFSKGSTLDFSGEIEADKSGDYWHYTVRGRPLATRLQGLGMPMNIMVFKGQASSMEGGGGQSDSLIALSTLDGAVAENSPEGKDLMASVADRQKKLNDEIAQNQQKANEDAARRQQAALENKKKKAEIRQAKEDGPWLEPFESKSGASIAGNWGNAMGWLVTQAQVDADHGTITGKGICLGQMPFRPFTFDAACDTHGRTFTFKTSLAAEPMKFLPTCTGPNLYYRATSLFYPR